MQSPLPASQERALFLFCASLRLSLGSGKHVPMNPPSFQMELLGPASSWRDCAALLTWRLAYLALAPWALSLFFMLAFCRLFRPCLPKKTRTAALRIRALLGRTRSLQDQCLFSFCSQSMGLFAYQRLACYWMRSLVFHALSALPHDGPWPIALESEEGGRIGAEIGLSMAAEPLSTSAWGEAILDSYLMPEDFDGIDHLWEISQLESGWSPAAGLPGMMALRLSCAWLSSHEGPQYSRCCARAARMGSASERSELECLLRDAKTTPSRGSRRL